MRHGLLAALVFGTAIFASAFLLFLVQPLVGKRILPWFGGVPAVWSVCLAFYQTTLFLGYAYAHALVRLARPRLQLAVHSLAIIGALLLLPVLPSDAWKPAPDAAPMLAILAMLAASVGAPFLVLAATGPLVQAWFALRYPDRSPYFLYAISNAGSLLALLGYPFLIEPHLPLSVTGELWSKGFAVAGIAVLGCAALAARGAPMAPTLAGAGESRAALARGTRILWLLLPGTAVMLLMGVTNQLCLDVASVPFLWVLPLAVYLATFILCFGAERSYRRALWVVVACLAVLPFELQPTGFAVRHALTDTWQEIPTQVALYGALLFSTCMVMHGELYRLRPPASALTAFYLCISAGGALGGLFVGLVAPRVFDAYYELPLGLVTAALLLLAACWRDPKSALRAGGPRWRWAAVGVLATGLVLQALPLQGRQTPLHQERTFFGVLRVVEIGNAENRQRRLNHGTTLHGVQFLSTGARRLPTSYFGRLTGIGLALQRPSSESPRSIGIVGLGAGTLATYGRPGDRIRFYEIDPAVLHVARDAGYFSYLTDSPAEIEVTLGDARLALEAERKEGAPGFDLLVIDAFSSDAIPVHLLTREAFAAYADRVVGGGLIAVHVSSRHFDLARLVSRVASSLGLHVLGIWNEPVTRFQSARARWIFLSRDEAQLRDLAAHARARWRAVRADPAGLSIGRALAETSDAIPLWTDDYSDLFGLLKSGAPP